MKSSILFFYEEMCEKLQIRLVRNLYQQLQNNHSQVIKEQSDKRNIINAYFEDTGWYITAVLTNFIRAFHKYFGIMALK